MSAEKPKPNRDMMELLLEEVIRQDQTKSSFRSRTSMVIAYARGLELLSDRELYDLLDNFSMRADVSSTVRTSCALRKYYQRP